ncbi:hypothetical protein CSUI_002419, partial [Cystoisospora suis]
IYIHERTYIRERTKESEPPRIFSMSLSFCLSVSVCVDFFMWHSCDLPTPFHSLGVFLRFALHSSLGRGLCGQACHRMLQR